MENIFENAEIISMYTRAQALEDGELVDVTETAKEAGIKLPVAMTRAAWGLYVDLSPAAKRAMNDEKGRLWDVVWMLACAMRSAKGGSDVLHYDFYCVTRSIRPSRVTLKAVCSPDDDGEPVITLMLPDED